MRAKVSLYIGLLLVLGGCVNEKIPSRSQRPEEEWRSRQSIWWNDTALVKDAVCKYAQWMHELPEPERSTAPDWEISKLVLILDKRDDESSLRALSDLTSYYLGESGGEVLRCVTIRKGKAIVPLLKKDLSVTENDCLASSKNQHGACRTVDEYHNYVTELVNAIERNQSCYIEQ